ncbi:UvrD-helicase domain-containing protein [Spongiibacter taiwanensis]|uniref:UvrD-helicase domain-containing protein n=1 Tax=Spongiibacter taiwanensis TaxID=1748242 RepID=UPI0020362E49|nr:UvrD-helicase domain-containing protein [Spongiibacter taiwanensis]USA41685.1 UvrD-helicase domain-containing protein [Spongiibacter taiwanensis]
MSHGLPPDQAHRDRAVDPRVSVLLRAPAGSGKTGVLLLRYLRCLLTVAHPEQVVAITFTNKAAGEIKERVIGALQRGNAPAENAFESDINEVVEKVLQRDAELGWQLLENSARLRIATFDSFCGSLTRRMPLLSGMGAARPLTDTDALYRQAILTLFRQLDSARCPPDLAASLSRLLAYGNNRIESLLPLLAALLAKRDQWLGDILSGDIDAMEEALAAEIRGRYQQLIAVLRKRELPVLLSAFIEASSAVEEHAWAAVLDLDEVDHDEHIPLLQKVAESLLNTKGEMYRPGGVQHAKFRKGQPGTQALKDWLAQREAQGDYPEVTACLGELASLPAPGLPESSRELVEDFRCALRYLAAYLRLEFEHQGGVDFVEIAQRAIFALRPGQVGDEVGEALLVEDRIEHILVDEMQDTSVSQIELLSNLCQDWQEGDGRSVFFCGDLQQSIYAFRGSLVALFDDLIQQARFANRPLELLQLTANFRSSATLVNWVNRGFSRLFDERGGQYTPAIAQRSSDGCLHIHPYVQAYQVNAKGQVGQQEAADIVALIQRRQAEDQATGKVSSIAILARSRRHLAAIVPALKGAGIAFSGQDIDTLVETPAVLDFTALLRSLWHEADNVAWARLARAPFVGLSWEDLRLLRQPGGLLRDALFNADGIALSPEGRRRVKRVTEVIAWIEAQPQSRDLRWALRTAWHQLGGPACVTETEYRDVERVLALLSQHAPAGLLEDIGAFESALQRLFATPPVAPVELMTVHKSKGLEFDLVILPGLGGRGRNEDSPLLVWQRLGEHMVFAPKPQAGDDQAARFYRFFDGQRRAALAEELDRQLYVALTRAKVELHLFGLASEDKNGEIKAESASFLGRLWEELGPSFDCAMRFEQDDEKGTRCVPLAPRMENFAVQLQRDYQAPALPLSPLQQAQRFSENAVLEDNIEERATGIVFHELMEKLGRGGVEEGLYADRARLGQRIALRLRHHCHPEPGLSDSVDKVLGLLDNTRDCEVGQWILGSFAWQANEQTLRRLVGGQWQSLILDRVFLESDPKGDKCWIIDYKTARGSGDLETFFAGQAERYRHKMTIYRNALAATGVQCPIVTALYFPAHRRLLILD